MCRRPSEGHSARRQLGTRVRNTVGYKVGSMFSLMEVVTQGKSLVFLGVQSLLVTSLHLTHKSTQRFNRH